MPAAANKIMERKMKSIISVPIAALTVGVFSVAVTGFAPRAAAELLLFQATLDQAQTAPAAKPAPGAAGQAALILDTETNQISWVIDYVGLSGKLGALHFHGPAPAGQPAGVQVNIGEISGTDRPVNGSAEITAEQAADLQAGKWYVNLHTALNGPGEVRGQLTGT